MLKTINSGSIAKHSVVSDYSFSMVEKRVGKTGRVHTHTVIWPFGGR